jgi:hypothetical protein
MQRAPCLGLLVAQVDELLVVLQALVDRLVGLGQALNSMNPVGLPIYAASFLFCSGHLGERARYSCGTP